LLPQWQASGSVTFTPIWQSLDGTVAYLTGTAVRFDAPQRGSTTLTPIYEVSVYGARDRLASNEQVTLRINIFDRTSPYLKQATRVPVELPGKVVRDVHWQVSDAVTGAVVVPFDTEKNSTRASSDASGMYFKLDASNLTAGHSYVIDVLVATGDDRQVFESASPAFRVGDAS
jgi:hypothetical protein